MDGKSNKSEEKDINDVFDSIAFPEEQISKEAFQTGLIQGKEEGKFEGYHLGFHKGLQLGTEIGFYKGLSKVLIANFKKENSDQNEKIQTVLNKFSYLLNNIPNNSGRDIDILEKIGEIRSNYKKLNSLLKLNLSFPSETSDLSF